MFHEKPLEELTLLDDWMFSKIMSQESAAKLFLETLLGKPISKVTAVTAQSTTEPEYSYRGVRFDVEFVGDGEVYNIEMQQCGNATAKGMASLTKRARYYHAVLDTKHFARGADYAQLPSAIVIFICNFDPFNRGLAVYTQRSVLLGLDVYVPDGSTTLYLNTQYAQANINKDIAEFLTYLRDVDAVRQTSSSFVRQMHGLVEDARMNPTLRSELMSYYEKMQEYFESGKKEGREEVREEAIQALMGHLKVTYEEAKAILFKGGENQVGGTVGQMHLQ